MITTLVHIWVKPEYKEAFLKATIKNHDNTILEPGNFRFDVIQEEADLNKFVLIETFASETDIAFHKTTPHYFEWKETVEPMMAQTRQGIKHKLIRPIF